MALQTTISKHPHTTPASVQHTMAPRKRSRATDDIDGEVGVESASSSLRHNLPKRSRVTLAQENGGSVVSDDEDEVDGYGEGSAYEGNSAMEYSMDEDDDIDELRMTQVVQKQMDMHRDNMASEQGVIEEVFCRNFMCHSKLRIKLGPLINFIIGHNGSGKSAVLTALTMCLGGKATATNRGASLKSLIKEGEESATLAVKIKNQGDGAYKPDLYGHSITVERHFSRAGTSGFKLKNSEDKVISTKKADLDDILDFFAFQLDNPINVLTQDMARQFLSNSSPSDKYKFFIRGTQLEVLDADYKLLEEHLDSIQAKLYSRRQDIEVLKQRMDEAERKKKRSEMTQAINEKITHLQWMHAWAQVEEEEDKFEKYSQQVQLAEEKVQEKNEAAEGMEGEYEGHNQSYEAAVRNVEDFQGQLRPVTDKHASEKEQFDKVKNELLERKAEERKIKEDLKAAQGQAKKNENDIREEQSRLADAEGPEHTERLEKLEELKREAEAKKQEQMEHGTGFAELERKRADAEQNVRSDIQKKEQTKDALNKAEGRLRSLQDNLGRQYAAYRPNMENLVRAINQETRWRSKPVGPMGLHIRLLKSQWTSQIETTLGGNLESFIVTCKEDQDNLSKIMKRVNCTSSIFIGHPDRLDTTGKEPVENVDTILRVLEIDNDLVRNSLIINQAAEQTVLIADREEARSFMYDNGRPRNVKATMCILSDRSKALRFEYSGRGELKSTNVPAPRGPPRMKTDIQGQIRIQKDSRDSAFQAFQAAEQEVRRLQMALKTAEQELKRFERTQRDLKTEVQQAEDAVDEQQGVIESHRPQDGRLQELERQLQEAKENVESLEATFQDMVNTKDDLNNTQQENKARLDAATAELNQAKARVDKAEKRQQQLEQIRIKALQEKNLALEKIDEAKRVQSRMEERRDNQRVHLEQFVGQAEHICRRVTVEEGLTPAVIDERIDKFIKDRERAEREAGGTREELILAWQKARQEFTDAEAQMQGMVTFSKVYSQSSCAFVRVANHFGRSW